MDEQELAAVFRAAASWAPTPGFDHAEVVAASRRATARRRSAVVGGALAALAVAGVGVAAAVPDRPAATVTAAAPEAAAERAAGGGPGTGPGAASDAAGGTAGGTADRAGGAALAAPAVPAGPPLGPADPGGCVDPQDPALRALLDRVLPEVAGAAEAVTTMVCEPGGGRAVHLEVADGAATGLLVVEYRPPGGPPRDAVPGPGAATASAPTASGGTVTVTAVPAEPGGPAPFAPRLEAVTDALAPRL